MRRRGYFYAICLIACIQTVGSCFSYRTAEWGFLHKVSSHLEEYYAEHGKYPKTWEELESSMESQDFPLEEQYYYVSPKTTYRFVNEEILLPRYSKDSDLYKALLISVGPLRDSTMARGLFGTRHGITEKNYFALAVDEEGKIWSVHLPPSVVKERYQAAGVLFPRPIEIPERKWVTRAKGNMLGRYLVYTLFLSSIAYVIYYKYKRKKTASESTQ